MKKLLLTLLLLLPTTLYAERWAYFGEDTPYIDLDTMSLGNDMYAYRVRWIKENTSTSIYVVDCKKKVYAHIYTQSNDTTVDGLTFSNAWYSSYNHSYIDDYICP